MKITYARALRIQEKLLKDQRFVGNLGDLTLQLQRKDGITTAFHAKVEAIANELVVRGIDANICKTEELYAAADFVLAGKSTATPETAAEVVAAADDGGDGESAEPAQAAAPKPVEVQRAAPAKPAKAAIEVKWTLPVYSLLVSAAAIAERDKSPKAVARKSRLDALVAEYYDVVAEQ